jgi:hypothetical protein
VGNFRIEPPGLFRGRGDHPKTGKLKKRVTPEMVTLNLGVDAVIPEPPAGHKWKTVVHKNDATWLATWQENVNNAFKYVFLAATSTWKGQSDLQKYEKARELKVISLCVCVCVFFLAYITTQILNSFFPHHRNISRIFVPVIQKSSRVKKWKCVNVLQPCI